MFQRCDAKFKNDLQQPCLFTSAAASYSIAGNAIDSIGRAFPRRQPVHQVNFDRQPADLLGAIGRSRKSTKRSSTKPGSSCGMRAGDKRFAVAVAWLAKFAQRDQLLRGTLDGCFQDEPLNRRLINTARQVRL